MPSTHYWRQVGWDLKSRYQTNMLRGMCCVYAPVIVAGILLLVWTHLVPDIPMAQFDGSQFEIGLPETTLPSSSAGPGDLSQVAAVNPLTTEPAPSARVPGPVSLLMRKLGRNNRRIQIVRDDIPRVPINISNPVHTRSPIDAAELVLSDGIFDISADDVEPFATGAGGDDLYGLGNNTFGLPGGIYCPPSARITGLGDETGIKGSICLARFFWPPSIDTTKVGTVQLIVTIPDKGRRKTYQILHDEIGFGPAIIEMLDRSNIRPPLIDGKKATVSVKWTFQVCWRGPESFASLEGLFQRVETSGN